MLIKRYLKDYWLLFFILTITSIGCALPAALLPQPKPAGKLVLDYSPGVSADQVPLYEFSSEQHDQIINRGYPDRFLILFFVDQNDAGLDKEVRQETWYYDQIGLELVFHNGVLMREFQGDAIRMEGLGRTGYNPEFFYRGMGLAEISAITAQNGFYQEPISEDQDPRGMLHYFQGLVVGLENDQLRYVETLPLGDAGLPY